jgi:hypothetical protein
MVCCKGKSMEKSLDPRRAPELKAVHAVIGLVL